MRVISETAYHVIDLIMEAVYLPAHLWFLHRLIKGRMPSPVWRWCIVLVGGLWGIVCGGFIETVLLLFWNNNKVYAFGVSYQLASTIAATMAFLLWNLYIAGHVKLAENHAFRRFVFGLSAATATVVVTDPATHYFYKKLVLGEPVVHGILFVPCVFAVYGMLIAGWIISLVHIARHGEDKLRRAVIFSMYPLLPGAVNLIRSITGFTLIDVNPIVMTVCIACLYSMVFRRHMVSIMPASIEQALEQTGSILFTVDSGSGEILYRNRLAEDRYSESVAEMIAVWKSGNESTRFEGRFAGNYLKANVSVLGDGEQLLFTATDVTEIKRQQEDLLARIKESTSLLQELEEKKRNTDAYIDMLYRIPNLKEKWEKLTAATEESRAAFGAMEENLKAALEQSEDADERLGENLLISERTIAKIREAVATLREDA